MEGGRAPKCVQRGEAVPPHNGFDRLLESVVGLGGDKSERAFPGRRSG